MLARGVVNKLVEVIPDDDLPDEVFNALHRRSLPPGPLVAVYHMVPEVLLTSLGTSMDRQVFRHRSVVTSSVTTSPGRPCWPISCGDGATP